MGIDVLVFILIGFMFIAALIATESKDLLSSVIAVGAVGIGVSIIDLLLGAPDLAFPQIVVEVIALVMLIRVVLTRQELREESMESPRDALRIAVVLFSAGIFLVAAFFAFGGLQGKDATADASHALPPFGEPVLSRAGDVKGAAGPGVSKDYLERAADETGAANAVTAVLLDYRAYDTLGEATVIFAAVLGGYALLRRVGRRKEVST